MTDKKKLSRHECREEIFKLIFAKEFDKECSSEVFYNAYAEEFEELRATYIKDTFLGICNSIKEIDSAIEATSIKWKLSRMSTATRSVLRLAVYEMTKTDVPVKAIINEAIEIVKVYDDESAPAFVNGILNKIARENGLIENLDK